MNSIEQIKKANNAYVIVLKSTVPKSGFYNNNYYCSIYTDESGVLNSIWDIYNECKLQYAVIDRKQKFLIPGFYFPAFYFKVKHLNDLKIMLKEVNPALNVWLLIGGSCSPITDNI